MTTVEGVTKKRYYQLGLILNIGFLFVYKLLQDVLSGSGVQFLQGFDNAKWILLGIGFYILQIISYYFDVYKASAQFDHDYLSFSVSIAFFSKLPSGPILNNSQSIGIIPNKKVKIEEGNIAYGLQRILLGMFKKIALADRLLPYVNNVFDSHSYINGLMIYLGPFLFTMQLYFDFSGYIDIAIGSARLFGIKLPENFNVPLRARSITQFWRRWHITLVNWLTKYVFYPISFTYRKLKNRGVAIAIISTFLVSAAWHGFALTFFVWALCHFSYIIIENIWKRNISGDYNNAWLSKFISVVVVWHLVAFSNIFFRSKTLQDAGKLFADFAKLPFLYADSLDFKTWLINGGQDISNEFNFRLTIFLCLVFLILERKINRFAFSEKYSVVFVAVFLIALVVFGMFNTAERFVYMQF